MQTKTFYMYLYIFLNICNILDATLYIYIYEIMKIIKIKRTKHFNLANKRFYRVSFFPFRVEGSDEQMKLAPLFIPWFNSY